MAFSTDQSLETFFTLVVFEIGTYSTGFAKAEYFLLNRLDFRQRRRQWRRGRWQREVALAA